MGRGGPAPTQCVRTQCFDPLVRGCVACRLFRSAEPRPASPAPDPRMLAVRPSPPPGPAPRSPAPPLAPQPSSPAAPGRTAVQPQESGGSRSMSPLLLGTPAMLGLALALLLAAALGWRRCRRPVPPKSPDTELDESLDAIVLSPGPREATGPSSPSPGESPAATSPAHSVPVPATSSPAHSVPVPAASPAHSVPVPAMSPAHSTPVPAASPAHSTPVPAVSPAHSVPVPATELGSMSPAHSVPVPAASPAHSVPVPATELGSTSPAHSVPVPATELGSTELVTTKTAGPEQQ